MTEIKFHLTIKSNSTVTSAGQNAPRLGDEAEMTPFMIENERIYLDDSS